MAGYDSLILDHDGVLVSIVDSDTRIRTCCRRAADAFRDVGVRREVSCGVVLLDMRPRCRFRDCDDVLFCQ